MKIGILTQPLYANYGGILQNYALQKVLLDNNYEVITFNRQFNNPGTIKQYLGSAYYRMINNFKGNRTKIFTKNERDFIASNTRKFIEKNICLSEILDSDGKIEKIFKKHKFHALIVGSDQVWRPSYSPNIYNYFLDFAQEDINVKKVAYAASFGVDHWEFNEDQTNICSNLARLFDGISVREVSGIKLCSEHLNVHAEHVLDPTMLLDQNDYLKVSNYQSLPDRKGVFTYILDKTEFKRDVIEKIRDILNLDVYENQPKESFANPNSNILENYVYPSVETWIKSFHDADFVVTDSFHGTVFSILFKKPFIVIGNTERGQTRFSSLLSIFNLQNRLISSIDEVSSILENPIDYTTVYRILNNHRERSKSFLINSIQR